MHLFQINKDLLWMKIHYFLGIAGLAPIAPFLSTISKQRGYSPVIVGLIFTIYPLPGLLLRPIIGAITDKYKCRKSVFLLNMIISCILVIILLFIPGTIVEKELDDAYVLRSPLFWLFTMTIVMINTGNMVRTVLEDTVCFDLLGEHKHKYGEQRMWGAIGWGLVSIASGVCIDMWSKGQEYKNYSIGYIIALTCFVLDIYAWTRIKVVQSSDNDVGGTNITSILTKVKVQVFLLWVVFFGMLCSVIWYYLFWYMEDLSNIFHPETKPFIKTLQGLSLTIQCFGSEVPVFFLSSYILKRMDHMKVFSLMFFVFGARFIIYSFIENPYWVLPVELLNGITFALTYAAATSYASHIAPVGVEGTLQGIVGTCFTGIGAPIGSFICGYLFDRYGSIDSFKIMGGFSLAICIVQIIVNHLVNRMSKDDKNVKEET